MGVFRAEQTTHQNLRGHPANQRRLGVRVSKEEAHPPERVQDDPWGPEKNISGLANGILVSVWNIRKTLHFAKN